LRPRHITSFDESRTTSTSPDAIDRTCPIFEEEAANCCRSWAAAMRQWAGTAPDNRWPRATKALRALHTLKAARGWLAR